jgi:hypothetical protein
MKLINELMKLISSQNVPVTLKEKFNALLNLLFLQGSYKVYFKCPK